MNADLLSILLLFDGHGLLEHSTREWQEYQKVGSAFVPQVVYEEIQFLSDRSGEPQEEKAAREFLRFFPKSQWQLTMAVAAHPSLSPPAGQALSKQARLAVAIAECAYGFALEHPHSLVVVVSNSQPLLTKLQSLNTVNLCGLTSVALLQWCRTSARPFGVTRQLQVMGRSRLQQDHLAMLNGRTTPPMTTVAKSTSTQFPSRATSTVTRPATQLQASSTSTRTGKKQSSWIGQTAGIVLILGLLGGLGVLGWRIVQPQQFDQLWNRQVAPRLPN